MNREDEALRVALRRAQRQVDATAPDFASVYRAARRRSARIGRASLALLAACAAIVAIGAVLLLMPRSQFTYVDVDDLMATTSWSAPSDTLIPERRFDIYQNIPRLFESTATEAGALL